jgi:hypothetical protein
MIFLCRKNTTLKAVYGNLKSFVDAQKKQSLSPLEKQELNRLRLLTSQLKKVSSVQEKFVKLLDE